MIGNAPNGVPKRVCLKGRALESVPERVCLKECDHKRLLAEGIAAR